MAYDIGHRVPRRLSYPTQSPEAAKGVTRKLEIANCIPGMELLFGLGIDGDYRRGSIVGSANSNAAIID